MRRIALSGVVMLALLIPAVPASAKRARHSTPPNCSTVHSQLVAADAQAQVFKALDSFLLPAIYGCVYGSRHTYELGPVSDCNGAGVGGCGGITQVALGGQIVAYDEKLEAPQTGVSAGPVVVVRNLRTGRVLRKLPTGTRSPPSAGPPLALVVKGDGAVAWIAQTRGATSHSVNEFEVYAAEAAGSRLLASGAEIDPSSLALVGSTLYWMQAGRAVSTVLN
jgi:hypothetical protein